MVAPAVLDNIPCSWLLMRGLMMVEVDILCMLLLVLCVFLSLGLLSECEGMLGLAMVDILSLEMLVLCGVLSLGLMCGFERMLGLDKLGKGVMDILGLAVPPSVDMSIVMASFLELDGVFGLSGL